MKAVRLSFPAQKGVLFRWLLGHSSPRRARVAGLLLLAVASTALVWVATQSWGNYQQLQATNDALEALRMRTSRAVRSDEPDRHKPILSNQQTRAWGLLVRQLNTPWSAVFDALEATTPETIALLSVESDARQGSIRIQAESKALDTLLVYAGTIRTTDPFAELLLIKHETNEQDPIRPFRLSIDLRLKDAPATPTTMREATR